MLATSLQRPSIVKSILLRLALALALLSFSRILLIVIAPVGFPDTSFSNVLYYYWVGLRFDLSALLYLNCLFIFLNVIPFPFRHHKAYRRLSSISFIIPNSLGILANLADAGYFSYSLKRTTGEALHSLNAGGDINRLLLDYAIDFWYILAIWGLFTALLIYWNKRYNYGLSYPPPTGWKPFLKHLAILFLALILTITGMRGGWQLRPISIITASLYTPTIHSQLILSTPFTLLTTLDNSPIPDPEYFPDLSASAQYFNPVQQHLNNSNFRSMNVVVIILESFSSEYSAFLNPDGMEGCTGFTPFLDSLMQKSISFNGYANGTRSIEAVAAILSGLPSLIHIDFISSQYAGNCLPSLASVLKAKNYTSAFYHGGHNGTMNFDAFARKTGFDSYYGMDEYNDTKDFDGRWGIYDEPFLTYFCDGMTAMTPPFLGVAFTLSSHHPYSLPEQYQKVFSGGKQPIHRTIQYSDHAVKKFFERASATSWYDSTLFVITADHTSPGCSNEDASIFDRFRIPIIFYAPGIDMPAVQASLVQQCDILPSIMDILAYEQPFISFGQSIFDEHRLNYSMAGQGGEYHLIHDDTIVFISDGSIRASYILAKGGDMHLLPENQTKFTSLLGQAILQQYIYRLNHNLLCLGQ